MAIGAGFSQKQSGVMAPEHFMGKAVLKMSLQELQEFVQSEISENPALALQEERSCPVCGAVLLGDICGTCGAKVVSEDDISTDQKDDWSEDPWTASGASDDSYYEPFAQVANPSSLEDHLKEQVHTHLSSEDIPIAEFIIDCLDEDGYLREPLFDIASRFHLSVPQLEQVLDQVQKLDPPGIAARSLQECLLIQLTQLEDHSENSLNAAKIVSDCWESISRMKLDDVARQLEISRESVISALRFVREALNPHPANVFRDPWQNMTPRREAKLAPDVVIRDSETGLAAEVLDPVSNRVSVDELYKSLYTEMSQKKNGFSDSDRERVKESVQNAKFLIDALEFRKTTLGTVAEELLKCQIEFFKHGPAHLKPLTRKQLAQQIGLHESTVCRATDSKSIQLPTGEVIPFDLVFDSALPIKELVRKLSQEKLNGRPLSDGQIAERLTSQGIKIARRTVAKYRDELRVLPADYRL
ncbi:MAG: RNA polymerase factor sigma-54 [Armatimonadota bacterium]